MISIKVNGIFYDKFSSFDLNLRFDAIASSFSFTGYFDPDNPEHKKLFKPLSYPLVEIFYNRKLILTGVIVINSFTRQRESQLTTFSGYSKTGVLEDCTVPEEIYPLQFLGLSLKQITEKLCSPFNIKVIDNTFNSNAPFTSVSNLSEEVIEVEEIKEDQKIKDYLSSICNQRNIVLTHDENGNLLLTKAKANDLPIQNYGNGVLSARLSTNGQNMFSDTLVMGQSDIDSENGSQSSIQNPYIATIKRTSTIKQSSGKENSSEDLAKNALSKQLKHISLSIVLDKIIFDNGDLIQPNKVITYIGKENYIYNRTKFFVQSVSIKSDSKKNSGTLTCVIPEVYTKKTPINIFE